MLYPMGWRYRLLSWFTRELHRRFAAAFTEPRRAQAALLGEMLGRAATTAYGQAHGFARITDPAEYRARVPLVGWAALEPWIQRIVDGEQGVLTAEPVHLFLRTSGSTGPAKLIPCTTGLERETGAARAWWVARLVEENERAAVGKHLNIYSPEVEGWTACGIPYGSNTGRIRNRQPRLVRENDPVPEEVFALRAAEARYELILRFALAARDLGTFSTANPSTVLLLVRLLQRRAVALIGELGRGSVAERPGLPESLRAQLATRTRPLPRRARELARLLEQDGRLAPPRVWPRLASLNTWRCGGAEFYEPRLRSWFDPVPLHDPGFSASEGFVAIPFTHRHPAGVINVAGHFFEFLPGSAPEPPAPAPGGGGGGGPPTLLVDELEPGMEVRPVLTTSGGLYRYDLGDVARVEGFFARTPTLRFLYRAGRVSSITGEKVSESQAVAAAAAAYRSLALAVEDFTVGLQLSDPPRYCLALELGEAGSATGEGCAGPGGGGQAGEAGSTTAMLDRLAGAFDLALGEANVEYRAKRDSLRLDPPVARLLPAGSFLRLRARLVAAGAPDGQVKIPHLLRPEQLTQLLERES